MLKITDILNYVLNGVKNSDPRFTVLDDEHIMDTKTGVEFHLYDDTCKVTHGDVVVVESKYFTDEEQYILFELKKLITDPEKVKQKQKDYPLMAKDARMNFSHLYEHPQPIVANIPEEETNAKPYTG